MLGEGGVRIKAVKGKLGGLAPAFRVSTEGFFFLKRGQNEDGSWERHLIRQNRTHQASQAGREGRQGLFDLPSSRRQRSTGAFWPEGCVSLTVALA